MDCREQHILVRFTQQATRYVRRIAWLTPAERADMVQAMLEHALERWPAPVTVRIAFWRAWRQGMRPEVWRPIHNTWQHTYSCRHAQERGAASQRYYHEHQA